MDQPTRSFLIQGTKNQNSLGGPNACIAADVSFIQLLAGAAGRITINSSVIDIATTNGRDLYNQITDMNALGAGQGLELSQISDFMAIIGLTVDTTFIGESNADTAFVQLRNNLVRTRDS